jgi:Bifunctional DNA primase/polymerase, N-terminal
MNAGATTYKELLASTLNLSLEERVSLLGEKPILLPVERSKKRPILKGWTRITWEETQKTEYQTEINLPYKNVGVLLGPGGGNICTIDIDVDDEAEIEPLLTLNPWIQDTLITRGSKGCQIWFRITGSYNSKHQDIYSLLRTGGSEPIAEFRASGNQSIIFGQHPATGPDGRHLRYQVLNAKPIINIEYEKIRWPEHWSGQALKGDQYQEAEQKKILWRGDRKTRRAIATDLLGPVRWDESGDKGFCNCPGAAAHTNPSGLRDTYVFLGDDNNPTVTVYCVHKSCRSAILQKGNELRDGIREEESIVLQEGGEGLHRSHQAIYDKLSETGDYYNHGGLVKYDSEAFSLIPVTEHTMNETLASVGIRITKEFVVNNRVVTRAHKLNQMEIKALLVSQAVQGLPSIASIAKCPVFGAKSGYNPSSRILVASDTEAPEVPFDEALNTLLDLLSYFQFETQTDKSRALAAILTPALRQAGLVGRIIPAWIATADQLNSGKTFLQILVAQIYGTEPAQVTVDNGRGVGGMEETIKHQLSIGAPFIQVDNIRGKIDSQFIESLITGTDDIAFRLAFQPQKTIKRYRFVLMMTGNTGFVLTEDQGSRSYLSKLKKQNNPCWLKEGVNLGTYVANHWGYYLGCVFGILREWERQGKPRSVGSALRFIDWEETIDAIVQGVCGLPRPTEGMKADQDKASSEELQWLEKVGEMVEEEGDIWSPGSDCTPVALKAVDLYELCFMNEVDVPGKEIRGRGSLEEILPRRIGIIMKKLFKNAAAESVTVAGLHCHRVTLETPKVSGGFNTTHGYVFTRSADRPVRFLCKRRETMVAG